VTIETKTGLEKLKNWYSPKNFEKEEDRQTAGILIVIIIGALLTYLVTILAGLFWKEPSIVWIGFFGMVSQTIPLVLYAKK
jgi:hypothetical protein